MLVPMFSQPYESVTPMSLVYDFRAYVEDIFNVDDLVEIVNFLQIFKYTYKIIKINGMA